VAEDKPNPMSELHTDMRAVFLTESGNRVLNYLCKIAHVNEATYVPGDTHETAHREGMRRVVLSILRFIDRDPQELLNLPKEVEDE
jgi:hypothetical protein